MPDWLPLRFLLATFAGRVNRHQADVIAYLVAENRILHELMVRIARDNPTCGYLRIQRELKKLAHRVAATTIASTLEDACVPPSPEPRAHRERRRGRKAGELVVDERLGGLRSYR